MIHGVILAGGLGTRLFPLTKITNKHLLPIYDQPMIYYPIQALKEAGIRDIVLVTGGEHSEGFKRLLGDGSEMGLNSLRYAYQEGHGGIADALRRVQPFTKGNSIAVILGDNLFERSIRPYVSRFQKQKSGAHLVLKKISDPTRFGVARFVKGRIEEIIEKPRKAPSSYAVTGLYFYDASVFDIIKTLKPSRRGELEITDVNNAYIRSKRMTYSIAQGWWSDSGTFESLHRVHGLVRKQRLSGKRKSS